ncbi:hypothetical protein Ancab_012438 [Ancistrocladus abbreviatus]
MGDKMENEHITIPMATYESSSQPLRASENVNPEIVHHDTSQLTPSGDASSVAEPPPPSGNAPPMEGAASKDEKWTPIYTCLVAVMCVLCIILFPLCLLCAMGAFLFCNKDLTEEKPDEHAEDERTKQSIYLKVQEFRGTAFHIAKMVSVIHSRIMIGLLTWLIINLSVKSLRRKIILGSHLWQWTLVVVIAAYGYPMINMLMSLNLHYLTKMYKNRKDAVYFVKGLKTSFNLIIFLTVLFLTWHFYFRSQKGLRKTSHAHLPFHIVLWTLVSLVIFSICSLFKNALLLKWEADAIYNRFSNRILRAGFQLYFLAVISGTHWDLFKPRKKGEMVKNGKKENGEKTMLINESGLVENTATEGTQKRKKEEGKEEKRKDKDSRHLKHEGSVERTTSIEKADEEKSKREREQQKRIAQDIKDRMLSKDLMTTYQIRRMAKMFITLARISSRDEEDDISDILEEFHNKFPKDHEYITEDNLREFLKVDEQDAELLYAELQGGHPRARVSYETFETWMVWAHKNCLALGYTLVDAKEVANWLNIVMTIGIVVIIIFSWLLLTKIATTKLLILVLSPFLAATYIFSDSFKLFLEGVIFAFVRHPFDVGDQCLVDGSEMEVKRISILTTTFLKTSGGEEVIYPNSILGTKTIVNLKGEPDPSDYIELNLDPTTKQSKILELRGAIKKFINGVHAAQDDDIHCRIVVKGIGNVIKIGVHFKHMMSILDVTHSQCLETKIKRKSEHLLEIKKILEDLEIKTV